MAEIVDWQDVLNPLETMLESKHSVLIKAAQERFVVDSQNGKEEDARVATEMEYVNLLVSKDAKDQEEERIALEKPVYGTKCHQCHEPNTVVELIPCRCCPRAYCRSCLRKVYGVRNISNIQRKCAHCRNICFCELGLQRENVENLKKKWTMKAKKRTRVVNQSCSVCSQTSNRINKPPWMQNHSYIQHLSLLKTHKTQTDRMELVECRQCGLIVHNTCCAKFHRDSDSSWLCAACSVFGTHEGQLWLSFYSPERRGCSGDNVSSVIPKGKNNQVVLNSHHIF